MVKCPVCSSQKSENMLSLEHQPIYQHPVSSTKGIKEPYFEDLYYFYCKNCEHAFQKTWDISVLSTIYEKYYYTPRPPDIGVQFQNNFMRTLNERFDVLNSANSILEIGCSAGEVLAKIALIYPDKVLAGFEPNRTTAARASSSGFRIYPEFFTDIAAQKIKNPFDIVFHRHVIEHIFDFEDFFKAHDNVCHCRTDLIIETPCLNWFAQNESMAPFHIEHVHVFSIHSLKILLEKYNWYLKDYRITSIGYMIGWFTRKKCNVIVPGVETPFRQTQWIKKNKRILKKTAKGKKLALWGAGSGGVKVMSSFNLCPDIIVDNNPAKAGKTFIGYEQLKIVEANVWIEQEYKNSDSWLVVVASTYYEEISGRLKNAGWKGEIVQPYALLFD